MPDEYRGTFCFRKTRRQYTHDLIDDSRLRCGQERDDEYRKYIFLTTVFVNILFLKFADITYMCVRACKGSAERTRPGVRMAIDYRNSIYTLICE